MSEEKDDFLREIDELLGDVDEDPLPYDSSAANGSIPDLELADRLNLTTQDDPTEQPAPKTG